MSLHALTRTWASSPISPVCVNSAFLCSSLHVWFIACALCLGPTPSMGVTYTKRLLPVSVIGMMYPLLALPPTPPSKRAKAPNDAIHSPRLICLAAKRPSSPGSSSLGLTSAALVCNLFEQSIRSQLLQGRAKATFSLWHAGNEDGCARAQSCNENAPAHDKMRHLWLGPCHQRHGHVALVPSCVLAHKWCQVSPHPEHALRGSPAHLHLSL